MNILGLSLRGISNTITALIAFDRNRIIKVIGCLNDG